MLSSGNCLNLLLIYGKIDSKNVIHFFAHICTFIYFYLKLHNFRPEKMGHWISIAFSDLIKVTIQIFFQIGDTYKAEMYYKQSHFH